MAVAKLLIPLSHARRFRAGSVATWAFAFATLAGCGGVVIEADPQLAQDASMGNDGRGKGAGGSGASTSAPRVGAGGSGDSSGPSGPGKGSADAGGLNLPSDYTVIACKGVTAMPV